MPLTRPDLPGLLDLVLPRACAGCAAPGRVLCAGCLDDLVGTCFAGGPLTVLPSPTPPGLGPVWAAAAYAGMTARLVRAYKDQGRRDLAPVLAVLLGPAIAAAAAGAPPGTILVPLPSSARAVRARGDRPVAALARRAGAPRRLPCREALILRGRVRDAVGLSSAERRRNVMGRMSALVPLRGRDVVLVDDVVTSGATLAEANRAIRAAGGRVHGQAVLAAAARTGGGANLGDLS